MLLHVLLFVLQATMPNMSQVTSPAAQLSGAWETTLPDGIHGLWIVTDKHFSITYYKQDPAAFISTQGGKWRAAGDRLSFLWEYHTQQKNLIGQEKTEGFQIEQDQVSIDGKVWKRIDDGTPGALAGAWVITGRLHNGEMNTHTPGARKTMKILSGTRFQWIAYNSASGEFFGTGGGSYTTENGKYTENIDFFSRDNSRVGASLVFDYELRDDHWHHSGHSSKGDPLYEVWTERQALGI